MLTYSFDNRNKKSLYEYLYTCIKDDIISGKLTPDTKLPSKRDFAKNHGISVVTVENAYGQLLAEGYIYSLPKKGFYVSEINNNYNTTGNHSFKNTAFNNISSSNQPYNVNNNAGASLENTGAPLENAAVNLVYSHTPKDNFPFSVWAKLMRQVLTYEGDDALNVPPTGGVMKLRRAIAHHLYEFRGITVNPEQIIIGAGTEYLYGLIVQLLGRDLAYGLENPSSRKIVNIYRSLGVKVNALDMDDEGVIPDSIGLANSQIIQISPSHHFPTGIVTSISRRYGLLQWANNSHGRYIIEDDYDSEFRLSGKPLSTLKSVDALGRVIYMNTFTKTLASTVRISYMVLPPELSVRFTRENSYLSCAVSNFEQYTLARFMELGSFETHLNRMRRLCLRKRDAFMALIAKGPLGKHASVSGQNAGLHFLLTLRTSENDETIAERALSLGVRIAPLASSTIKKGLCPTYLSSATRQFPSMPLPEQSGRSSRPCALATDRRNNGACAA